MRQLQLIYRSKIDKSRKKIEIKEFRVSDFTNNPIYGNDKTHNYFNLLLTALDQFEDIFSVCDAINLEENKKESIFKKNLKSRTPARQILDYIACLCNHLTWNLLKKIKRIDFKLPYSTKKLKLQQELLTDFFDRFS